MAGTLISYRAGDAPGYAGRLFDRLRVRLPKYRLCKDASQVAPGDDFVQAVKNTVASCDAVLVIIGRDWIGSTSTGGRRLSDPNDPVRIEIGAGLQGNQRLIPVLVGGAAMPAEQDLPSEIRGLARRQAVELRDANWNQDVEVLIAAIERQKGAPRRGPGRPALSQRTAILGGILAMMAVVIIVLIVLDVAVGSDAADSVHPGIRVRPELTLVAHDNIGAIAALPDRRIASLNRGDDELMVWNLATGESESLYKEYGIASIAGIADGRLAMGYWGYIKFLNPNTRKVEETIQLHDPYPDGTDTSIDRLIPLPDGMLLSFSSVSVGFCDLKAHKGHVIPMGAAPRFALLSGGRVALLTGGGIGVWNYRDTKAETRLEGDPDSGPQKDLALLSDGRIATTSEHEVLGLWNLETGKEKVLRPANSTGSMFDDRVFALPDGRVVEVREESIEVWNVSRDQPESVRTISRRNAMYMADPLLLADGRLVLAMSDGGILLWDPQAAHAVATLEGHSKPAERFLLLDDGRLASAGEDRTIRIWSLPPRGSPASSPRRR